MSSNKQDKGFKKQESLKAYQEPTKEVMEAIAETQRRVNAGQKKQRELQAQQTAVDVNEQQYEILVGQLKSAEARNRLRIMRIRHEAAAEVEVDHLISCQPTALRAIRLETIMEPTAEAASSRASTPASASGRMSKADRNRLNQLMSG